MFKTIVIGIIITIVGLFALSAVAKATGAGGDTTSSESYSTVDVSDENTVKVTLSGEVSHAGSYYIDPEGTLGDLLSLAGGVTEDADEKCYNTSLVINTRTSFYIAPVLTETTSGCVVTEKKKVDINSAEAADLIAIGFSSSQGPSLVTYRNENGEFGALEDIMNVSGIGKGTFEKVKNQIALR